MLDPMEIVFLGTGGSFPSPQRGVSSLALKTHGEILLFDCGEGTQRQLMRSSLSFMGITKVFITHFHGDHYLGLAGLLQTMALNGRTADLEIFGPKGTEQLVTILERISYYSRTYDLVLHELKEGQKEHFDGYSVTAVRLDHSIPTLGYLFEEDERPGKFDLNAAQLLGIPPGPLFNKLQNGEEIVWNDKVIEPAMVLGPARPGRKVCVAMDTKPIMNLPEMIKNYDVLIHEATADRSLEGKANKFGHSTAAQAATIAKEAKVKKLFMVHISPRYREVEPLIEEARAIFEESYLPSDLESYEVPMPESWEEDDKLWVVAEADTAKEGEEVPAEGEAAESAMLSEVAETAEAEALLEADVPPAERAPLPRPVPVPAPSLVPIPIEAAKPAPSEVPEPVVADAPEPAEEEEGQDLGISLSTVEAAMESKESAPVSNLKATTEELTANDGGEDEEDDEFDLDKAMREAGLDPGD
jgi:ribonuclease Z